VKKLRVRIDGAESLLQLAGTPATATFQLTGALEATGAASICEVQPGVYSVLIGQKSWSVHILPKPGPEAGVEAWIANRRYQVDVSDLRDRAGNSTRQSLAGPFELRALMPGKVVKLLVGPDEAVVTGQSLLVVEAMKMQNEMKSPKDGVVTRIYAAEGATVAAGERLLLVE
jgi:biotin carboxyl carrier protein